MTTARPSPAGARGGVPLAAMLEHPSWQDVTVLAGSGGHGDRILSGAVVHAELSTPFAEMPGPDAPLTGRLLVVLLPGERGDWRLDTLLRRAHAAGAAAVLLAGTEPLRRASHALAARLGLPVLGAADPLAAHSALNLVTAQPQLMTAETVIRTAAACQHAGDTVDELLGELTALLRRPTALFHHAGDRIAGQRVLYGDETGAVAAWLGGSSAQHPVPRRVELPSGAVLVIHPVPDTSGAGPPYWLAVRLPTVLRAESDAVAAALSVAAGAVRQRLTLRRLGLERSARSRASLLGELLHLAGDAPVAVRRRALDLGWQLDGWHTGVRIGAAPEVDVAGLRADVVTALGAEELDAAVVEQGDGWSAWITAEREPSGIEVERLAGAIRRAQRRLADTVGTYVGVGRVHAGPEGIARTLGEAGDAARLAQGRAATGRFLHVDRLGLAQLLLAWTRTDTFQPAARSLLEPLAGESGDLVRTLAAFLDAESSTAETAAVLGVHRNTVTARIARVQQLLGVDLADPDERLALHLACRTALTSPPPEGP